MIFMYCFRQAVSLLFPASYYFSLDLGDVIGDFLFYLLKGVNISCSFNDFWNFISNCQTHEKERVWFYHGQWKVYFMFKVLLPPKRAVK